jgi:hypothetical protein
MELMSLVSPTPSARNVFFITKECWKLLPTHHKNGYFDMQYDFSSDYDVLKLHGAKDLSMKIMDDVSLLAGPNNPTIVVSILHWITNY